MLSLVEVVYRGEMDYEIKESGDSLSTADLGDLCYEIHQLRS